MKIAVYCSSSEIVDTIYFEEAQLLGELISTNNHTLVYGGANVGLMNHLAITVKNSNNSVHGVITQKILDKGLGFHAADILDITSTMHERKALMEDIAEAFIILPGGFGTLEEMLEVITLKQLGYHNKPIVIINTNGFFDKLLVFFEQMYLEKFAKEDYRALYHIAKDSLDAINYINTYAPNNEVVDKWHKIERK
ncbi:MAG: TIGR00730 family Rossman fold protein [Bacteroidota bacterium]